jgi:DNA replication and repair protein RecF
MRWVAARAPTFAEHVREIAGGTEASLEYDASVPLPPPEEPLEPDRIAELFLVELARVEERERRRITTLVGPHRDDLRMHAAAGPDHAWVDLRAYGSGGQQRTAAVALRMVEGETLRDRLGSDPVILLDDVFAELDVGRSARILEWVEREARAQVILTAPKPQDFALRGGTLPIWSIRGGAIHTDAV